MTRFGWIAFALAICVGSGARDFVAAQNAAVADKPAGNAVATSDKEPPGVGPIRHEDWFEKIWHDRRAAFAKDKSGQEHALVFLGDSITQGWGDDFRGNFKGVKVANRGISGDTSRGLLARLDEDVLALDPQGVVLLIGTNDTELKVPPEGIASNVKLLLDKIAAHNPDTPVVLCQVFPTSGKMHRPTERIRKLNQLLTEMARGRENVTVLDTYTLLANADGEAKPEE